MRTLWFRGREDKAEEIARCFAHYFNGTVLDVGCDGMHLRRFIGGPYIGCDVAPPAHFVIDLERGLPVATRCVDTVVALDVLEHIDSIHAATSEMLRAARRWAIIGLPNMYEWRFRVAYLLGRRLSGKYGLPTERPEDRHKWIFSLSEARTFISHAANQNGFTVKEEILAFYRYNRVVPKLITRAGALAGDVAAGLFGSWYGALLERRDGENAR